MPLTRARLMTVVALAVAAFGGAFAIGKATAGGTEEGPGPSAAERVDVSSEAPRVARLRTVGSLPKLRVPPPRPDVVEDATTPTTETPTDVPSETFDSTPQEVTPVTPPVTQPDTQPDPGPTGGGDG